MSAQQSNTRFAPYASLALAAAGGVLIWWVGRVVPTCGDAHRALSIASTPARIEAATQGCNVTTTELQHSLLVDCIAAVTYAVGLAWALWVWWPKGWPSIRQRSLTIRRAMAVLPLAAGAFDLVENLLAIATARVSEQHVEVAAWPAAVLATVGVAKWGLAIVAVVALILSVYGAIRFRAIDFDSPYAPAPQEPAPPAGKPSAHPQPDQPPAAEQDDGPTKSAVCLSGGGIRSAAFSWGALAALEEKGIFLGLDRMYSISGGGYAAVSWSARREEPTEPGETTEPGEPSEPTATNKPPPRWFAMPGNGEPPQPFRHVFENRHYLDNGRGGMAWALVLTIRSLVLNLLVIAGGLLVIAVPLGTLARGQFGPVEGDTSTGTLTGGVEAGWWIPVVGQLALAFLVVVVSFTIARPRRRRQVLIGAGGFAGIGVAFLALLVGIPVLAFQLKSLFGGGVLQLALPAAVSWLIGILLTLLRTTVTKNLLRLGGVLSTAAMFVGVLVVVREILQSSLSATTYALIVLGALAFLVVIDHTGVQWWSMHPIYRDRLGGTFAMHRKGDVVTSQDPDTWRTWTDTDWPAGPEHIVCAATHRRDKTVTGLRAVSFTFARTGVDMHVPRLPDGKVVVDRHHRDPQWLDRVLARNTRFLRLKSNQRTSLISAAAMSGAAFNSAMGRHSKGSTDSLLAVLNLRLGVWLPNPRFETRDEGPFPKAGLRYLFHEVIGYYDIDDPFVQVSDGGHWENLGLVEALRARHATVVCVDASGGRVDSATTVDPLGFQELFEAIDVARIELGTEVRIDVDCIRPTSSSGRCQQNWATGTIVYHTDRVHDWRDCECPEGSLVYVKAMVSDRTQEDVIAFANVDRVFPDYPTGDQFLSKEQFTALVRLGHSAMEAAIMQSNRFTQWGVPPVAEATDD